MKISYSLLAIACALTLGACSQSTPNCDAEEIIASVKDTTAKEMANQADGDEAKQFTYEVTNIKTVSTNKDTGAHVCSSDLKVNASNGGSQTMPITYTVEKNQSGQVEVAVAGLRE